LASPTADENSLRGATIFLQRPISLGLLIAALLLCLLVALPAIRSKREEAFQE
jgi:TctA family transporter